MKTAMAKLKVSWSMLVISLAGCLTLHLALGTQITYGASQLQTVPPNGTPEAAYLPLIKQQAAPTSIATTIYIVQAGDTLASIARRFSTTVSVLLDLNSLPNPNQIQVGQRLYVPVTTATPMATITPTPTLPPTPTAISTAVWANPANPIEIFSPMSGGLYHSPVEVIGFSQTFEGSVNIRLSSDLGEVLAERNTQGGSVDGFDFFHSYVRFSASEPISASLEVFAISAQDGSEINKVTVPLTLLPGQRVIDVHEPTVGATLCNPVVISGYSNTFEANVVVDLRQRNGTIITQTSTLGGNLGVYRDFTTSLPYPITKSQPILASAYEGAASGLGLLDHTTIPVTLYPAGHSACP